MINPITTEKAVKLIDVDNTLLFKAPREAKKPEIKKEVEKLFNVKGEQVTEKLAKLRTKSYQANIYDFKKKYKGKITE